MTFLAPWATWFLAGVPVIVLLYLLKLKRRPIMVSTLLFWERVMQENRRRALFQKLRHLLSLLLHLLIFLLIVAALSKPAFDRRVRAGSSVVLVVDTRARMQAVEEGGTRFERALAEARRYIHEAGAGRQLALLTASATPNVVVPFHQRRTRSAQTASTRWRSPTQPAISKPRSHSPIRCWLHARATRGRSGLHGP
jgi:hypothetical protein